MGEFTGIEPILEWMEENGLLDALTEMLTNVSVESIRTVIVLLFSVISSLTIGGIILVVLAIVAVAIVLSLLVVYVLRAIGLMRIAKKLGVKNRFLAWIPYGNAFLLGACAERCTEKNGKKPWKWGMILLFTSLGLGVGKPVVQLALTIILSIIPGLSAVVNLIVECSSLILLAIIGHCLWRVLKEFMDNVPAIILALLGALGGKGVFAVLVFIVGFLKLRPAKPIEAAVVEDEISGEISGEISSEVGSENGCEITNT